MTHVVTALALVAALAVPAFAAPIDCDALGQTGIPAKVLVQQVDASGNTTLAGTPVCATRVVPANEAPNPCPAGDSLIAVVAPSLTTAFGIHAPNGDVLERYFCSSQVVGR